MNVTRHVLFLLMAALGVQAGMKSDIEFARPGGTPLHLDAFVQDGAGPFPACILVHGGGFTKGDKRTFITPLFEPLGRAGFVWFSIDYRLTETNEATWKVLRDASPLHHVRPGLAPYLLVHGTKDDKVPFDQSLRFQEKTKAAGNRCDLIVIEGGAHGMGGWEKIDPGYREKLVEWLREVLSAVPRGSRR